MNNLIKLFALNKQNSERKFEVKASAEETTIYLYDTIVSDDLTAEWWGGVSPQAFAKALNAITTPIVNLRINCPGGDVFAGRAMDQAIRQHKSTFIAHIDGYAASAASYVALACDEVEIAKGGFFMIHNAWTFAYGNADDLLKTADLLNKIDNSLVATYQDETSQDEQQIKDWMTAETWFNADESLQFGFADRIAENVAKSKAKAQTQWDLTAYSKAPAAQADELLPEPADEPAPPIEPETKETEPAAPALAENNLTNQTKVRQKQKLALLALH